MNIPKFGQLLQGNSGAPARPATFLNEQKQTTPFRLDSIKFGKMTRTTEYKKGGLEKFDDHDDPD